MPFVIDASIAACWLLPDEHDPVADAARARAAGDELIAPAVWWFEVRNLLVTNEKRGRIDAAHTAKALALLAGLRVPLDQSPDETILLALARKHRLSVYDAAYLELALRERIPLATLDRQLAAAANAEQIGTIDSAL